MGRQGFARIVNLSDEDGSVSIVAFDDSGEKHGPIMLSLGALQTVHLNSVDLEDGEASKGLPEGVGQPSQGDWWLELTSEQDINVLSYIRTRGGFLTSMHDVAPSEDNAHRIVFFNPGSDVAQESLLRLVNPSDSEVSVTIDGIDDQGVAAPGGSVSLTISPRAARTLNAMDLENGSSILNGSLGDGAGKWRLDVVADGPLVAINMLATPTGHLTNLSTDPRVTVAASDDRLPAPSIEVTGTRTFVFSWTWSGEAGETYAFDYASRINGRDWAEDCGQIAFDTTVEDTLAATYRTVADLVEGTVIEARYRYRNASNCGQGTPTEWSRIGSFTIPSDDDEGQPDLIVESASVDDDTPDAGTSFTLRVNVRNVGERNSPATTLRYYRSSNSTISVDDTEVGDVAVGGLGAGETYTDSVSLTAPSSDGTYYYGACVDIVDGESSNSNNCSNGVKVEVGEDGGDGSDSYCRDGDIIAVGGRCEIYSTSFIFEVRSNGRGCSNILGGSICAGSTINYSVGSVRIHASRNANDSWTINNVEPEPDD